MSNKLIHKMLQKQFSQNPILGNITFNTANGIVVIKEKDIIGNSIQSWLATWLTQNKISYGVPINTQNFPDYIINPNTSHQENLEIKSWFSEESPAFDIANFESYVDTLQKDPLKLDTDYLIFRYNIDSAGNIRIEDVFLKKIWEITCSSKKYALRVQAKRNVIYNIRPATWYSSKAKYQPFNNRKAFVQAISATLIAYRGNTPYTTSWCSNISKGYFVKTGNKL